MSIQKILWAYKAATKTLAENKNFPARMDEMTPREAEIANIACEYCGTLSFVQDCLHIALEEARCEVTGNPCGADIAADNKCQCFSCQFWQKFQEAKEKEKNEQFSTTC